MDNRVVSKNFYSLNEVAKILGLTYNHVVNNILKSGELKAVNVGTAKRAIYRVSQEDLNQYLANRAGTATQEKVTLESLIRKLQEIRGGSHIITLITRPPSSITSDDPMVIDDMVNDLMNRLGVEQLDVIDLFIDSQGGSPDAAYKIAKMLRSYAKRVNSIVPVYAKSAATLLACGTKEITMTPVSELGPVDPMIQNLKTGEQYPAKAIKALLSYESDKPRMEADKIDPQLLQALREKITPEMAGAYLNTINSAHEYVEHLLDSYMLNSASTSTDVKRIADKLTEDFHSHAFVIDMTEAQNIGLKIKKAGPDELQAIKELYGAYRNIMDSQGLTKLIGNQFIKAQQGGPLGEQKKQLP